MGLDYGYELIVHRPKVGQLLRALARHLAADDQQRLLAATTTGDGEVLRHIARKDYEQFFVDSGHGGGSVCFTFHFAHDPELAGYDECTGIAPVAGRVPIGCVWTSLECGEQLAVLRAVAATTGMSKLFERSTSVRQTFASIGRDGGASLVLFDTEQVDFDCVWPYAGRLPMPAVSDDFRDDAFTLDVDRYCDCVLRSATATFG